jgi:DNA end-binding protein Ku
MPPRASWKGQLRLSLVAFPVRLHNAVTSTSRITLNQLHADCGHRLRQQMVCPEHGDVDRREIVKGYEYEKGKYVLIDESDLQKMKLESDKTLELVQFFDAKELDDVYLNAPYYVASEGPVSEQAFRVIREAMKKAKKIGLGRVVLTGKEHVFALKPHDRGFLLTTLRYPDEVRSETAYFEDIKNGDVPPDQLKLAEELIKSKTDKLDLSGFADRYQESLLALISAKIEGAEPIVPQEAEVGKVINLMDALRQSVEQAAEKKPRAKSVKKAPAAAAKRSKRA